MAKAGVVTAAVIYLPLRDKLYAAAAGQGATLNDTPITVSTRDSLPGAHIIAAKPNLDPKNWRDGVVPDVTRAHRPSLAYRLSLVAEGRFDAMLTLRRSWEWDIAAGDLILREAGAAVSDRTGQPSRTRLSAARSEFVTVAPIRSASPSGSIRFRPRREISTSALGAMTSSFIRSSRLVPPAI